MHNAELDEAVAGIKIVRRNINNFRSTDDTTLMAESEEELKWKRRVEKLAQNSTFKKLRSWHPVPFTSWQIDVETIEPVTDFIFLGSKITADGDWSHEIKKMLAPWKKSYDKPRLGGLVVSDSLWPHELYSPWNSLGQNTGVGNLSLLQVIFQTQGSNPGLPHCRQILYQLSHKGSP